MGVPIFFKTSDKVWSLLGYLLWRILLTLPYSVLYMITRRCGNRDFYFRVGLIIWRQNLMIFFITLPKRTTMDIDKGAAFKGAGDKNKKGKFFKKWFWDQKGPFLCKFCLNFEFWKSDKKLLKIFPKLLIII